MRSLEIHGKLGDSVVVVGERLENLSKYLPGEADVIVTDTNVANCYRHAFPSHNLITIGVGEGIKTLETVEKLYRDFLMLGIQRSSFIVGIGGGVVCDITGFAASTYLRGVRFGFVSTTLLSQVDASVGGKNGVNFLGYKNMVGVFSQPEFVICDHRLLGTLPFEEVLSGFGEIIKHAAIEDPALFEYMEKNTKNLLDLDPTAIEKVVFDSVTIKAGVVNRDELETGERRKLNFGHSFGHAVEKMSGLPHGQAVAIGMLMAAELSKRRGLLSSRKLGRLKKLLRAFQLPTRFDTKPDALIEAMKKDKKREKDIIHFVLLEDIGRSVVTEIGLDELQLHVQEIMSG
jgi:3-dehydroquinate synthase